VGQTNNNKASHELMKIKSNRHFRRYVISWFLLIVGFIVALGGYGLFKSSEIHLIENLTRNKLAQVVAIANLIEPNSYAALGRNSAATKVYQHKLEQSLIKTASVDAHSDIIYSLNYQPKNRQFQYVLTTEEQVIDTEKSDHKSPRIFYADDVVMRQLNAVLIGKAPSQGVIANKAKENSDIYIYSQIKTPNNNPLALLVLQVTEQKQFYIREKILQSMAISFSLLSVLLMLAAIIFSRKVTGPVEMLDIAINRLIHNDFNFKLSSKGFGSFSFLASQFNLMISRLHKSRKQLIVLNKSYSRFVPHQLLKQLSDSGVGDIALGDSCERDMTILFCDVRGFTSLSETMSPASNFKFINRYLSQIAPVINKNNGIIDKYLGDGIMALFPTNADDAITAAINMIHSLNNYNKKLLEKRLPIIEVGIGLHTGKAMLGTVGTHQRMDVTVISDSVNAAARVESMTKAFGTKILITEETKQQIKDLSRYKMRYIADTQIQGKTNPVTLYEIFDNDPLSIQKEKANNQATMIKAWKTYHKGNPELAIQMYQRLIEKSPHDKSLFALIERCQSGRL
jgi:class 3 adenylate cyclase